MHPVVNHLIQLQELALAKDVRKVAVGPKRLEQLDDSIKELTSKLPHDMRVLYTKLHKKDHIVLSPVANGHCAVCRMKLPISQVQSVRQAKEVQSCPNCARVLYYPESAARSVGGFSRRYGPRKAGISRFSSEALMIPRLKSEDKEGVIQELAFKMEEAGFVDKAQSLVEQALRREAIISTAVDHGLAFPHVRGVEGGGLTLALGLSPKGIPFDGLTKQRSKIIFFMLIPTAAAAFYLKILAGLTETFMKADARKAIMVPKEPDKLWKALVKATRVTIK